MKLLFENWRQYLNENLSKKEIEQAISDASFNSAQSSQHRWGRGQPIIDYTDTPDGRTYTATYPDGTENSDLWPSRELKNTVESLQLSKFHSQNSKMSTFYLTKAIMLL